VALMQPWLKGLANVRGTLHTVIDVAVFVGRQPAVAGERTRLLIVAERFGLAAGLLVDASLGLRHPGQLERCDEAPAPWMRAVFADRDGRRWSELDLAGLVQHPGFLAAGV